MKAVSLAAGRLTVFKSSRGQWYSGERRSFGVAKDVAEAKCS
jgi:hypothetical protein